jgi:integral membrane sensor domain MASE1/anti-sigma regulatory factor (Ser/Thr protein kinase)
MRETDQTHPWLRGNRRIVTILALAAVYFLAAKAGLQLAFVHASATAVWPPTGIALAALLLVGYGAWPGIFLGAFLANLTTAGTVWTSIGIATGNTLEALLGAYLVIRYAGGSRAFDRAQGIFMFAVLAAVVSTTVSATIGVASLTLGGFAQWTDDPSIWLTWWLGDASGALIVTPLVVLWARGTPKPLSREQTLERLLLFVAALGVGAVVFAGAFAFEYLTVPLLIWAAFRFGRRETAALIALLAVIAIWGTLNGRGPFIAATQNTSLLLLQTFMAMMVLFSLPLAAVVAERSGAMTAEVRRRLGLERALEVEQGISETLQRSLLPAQLPRIPGLSVAAHYVSASAEAVGGDWYDVLLLPGGAIGLVIGDVAGKGVAAAATTAKLRHAIRAYALEGHPPADLMDRVSDLLDRGEMATLLYLVLDPLASTIRYTCAGHPPAVLVEPGRPVRFLEGSGLPAGAGMRTGYTEFLTTVAAGSTLILYTDGLVESPAVDIERGLARLQVAAGALDGDVESLPRRLAAAVLEEEAPRDDVAVFVLRMTALDPAHVSMRLPAVPASVPTVRHTLQRWLVLGGADPADSFAVCVAVGEACTNAVEHAYGPVDAVIEVDASCLDGLVTVSVRDRGTWRPRREQKAGGRGMQVMRAMMDRVDVRREPTGTTVLLAYALRRGAPR